MNKYGKMTNEELLEKFESESMTIYDYANRTIGHEVKQITIDRAEKRFGMIKAEIMKRMNQ